MAGNAHRVTPKPMTTSSENATPPVTMVVTGYNQADLIGEAIAGALAQDYPNLQIILSDDASSDDTFARMEAAATTYRGPHRVLAHRLPRNAGTLGNIYSAAGRATGDLVVLAGGDDISYPHRVSTLARCWLRTGADAYYSKYDLIDEAGRVTRRGYKPDDADLSHRRYFPYPIEPLHGASAALDRRLFDRYPLPAERVRSEDAFFTLMLALDRGRIEYVDEPLVAYRQHGGAITNEVAPEPRVDAVLERERRQARFAASQADLLRLFAREREARNLSPLQLPHLNDDTALFEARAKWMTSSLTDRIGAFAAARRRGQLGWLLPRLLGPTPFALAKVGFVTARKVWR